MSRWIDNLTYALGHRARMREARWWRLRDELRINEEHEDQLVAMLPISGGVVDRTATISITENLLALRIERIRILRRLGWTESADRLADETLALSAHADVPLRRPF